MQLTRLFHCVVSEVEFWGFEGGAGVLDWGFAMGTRRIFWLGPIIGTFVANS